MPGLKGCALLCREGHGGGCIPLLVGRGGGGDILNGSGVRTGIQVGGGDIRVRDGTGGGVIILCHSRIGLRVRGCRFVGVGRGGGCCHGVRVHGR